MRTDTNQESRVACTNDHQLTAPDLLPKRQQRAALESDSEDTNVSVRMRMSVSVRMRMSVSVRMRMNASVRMRMNVSVRMRVSVSVRMRMSISVAQ